MEYRIFIAKDVELREDTQLAVFCDRLDYLQEGWHFVRLLDMKGKETSATLLVRFDFTFDL